MINKGNMLKTSTLKDCINILYDYKAYDIVSYNNKPMAEKIILSSCESGRQVKAVALTLIKYFKNEQISFSSEGMEEGNWVLIDSEEMIIHIFRNDVREYYDIDNFLNN